MSASSSAAAGGAGGLSTIGTEGSTLLHHTDFMASCKVVLASQSPRRKEIFDLMGLSPIVEVSGFEEDLDKSSFAHPGDYAATNAEYKAREVAEKLLLAGGYSSPTVVVGSDTIVDLDGKILEKPQDDEEAFRMLSSLSGRQHLVHSGVAIFTSQGGCTEPALRFYETTSVLFAPLSETEIRAYIATREPFDKSGAYGIQGWGGQFVQKIDGCYFNVMGFPMHKFSGALAGLIRESKV